MSSKIGKSSKMDNAADKENVNSRLAKLNFTPGSKHAESQQTLQKVTRKRTAPHTIPMTPCTPATAMAAAFDSKLTIKSTTKSPNSVSRRPRPVKVARSMAVISPLPAKKSSSSFVKISPFPKTCLDITFEMSPSSPKTTNKQVNKFNILKVDADPGDTSSKSPNPDSKKVSEFYSPESLLPTISSHSKSPCSRISVHTLADALKGRFNPQLRKCAVIDCRFDYEYKGGHIRAAVNTICRDEIRDLFTEMKKTCSGDSTAVVFHCEYSKHRAPKMSAYWRQLDREISHYPHLSFPHVYVLDGGYKEFFRQHPDLCEPRNYVSMFEAAFAEDCKEQNRRFRTAWHGKRNGPSLEDECSFDFDLQSFENDL